MVGHRRVQGKRKEKSKAGLAVTSSMRSPDTGESSQHLLMRIDSGTDGLFTCPSLRQPGNLAWKDKTRNSVPRGPWLCVTASRRFCPFRGWKGVV